MIIFQMRRTPIHEPHGDLELETYLSLLVQNNCQYTTDDDVDEHLPSMGHLLLRQLAGEHMYIPQE